MTRHSNVLAVIRKTSPDHPTHEILCIVWIDAKIAVPIAATATNTTVHVPCAVTALKAIDMLSRVEPQRKTIRIQNRAPRICPVSFVDNLDAPLALSRQRKYTRHYAKSASTL